MQLDELYVKYSRKMNKETNEKRLENIQSFSELDRTGLCYGEKERLLLLHTTKKGEKLYIQYPGLESARTTEDKNRPWDFRPKLELPDGTFLDDLSFSDIWDDLSQMHTINNDILSILATVLFKMSLMLDYKKVKQDVTFFDVDIPNNKIISKGTIDFSWYKPVFSNKLLRLLQKEIGNIRGVSVEAYLIYNELLVQNEDCKYFYRDTVVKNRKWNKNIGRKNTFFSHLSVIEYLQNKIKFSQIMKRFQRGMGVAPIPLKEIPDITNNFVVI